MLTEYINRETLRDLMYTEAFERDTGLQRWDSGLWIRYKLFENCINAIPAADVVEVVRCGECIYLEKDSKFDMTGDGNEDARFCGIIGCCTNDDWFCADGERKDGGQDDV